MDRELVSCFHHIARGLCLPDVDLKAELTAARKSHIKRAILDSYKIAINFILKEDEKLREILDYLVLAEDFSKYIPDGMDKVNKIKESVRKVKLLYTKAKKFEATSEFDNAIESYNASLSEGMDLLDLLEAFTKDKVYLLAFSREVSNKKEKKKDRWIVILASIFGACVGAFITSYATIYVAENLNQNSSNIQNTANMQPQQSPAKK